MTSMRWLVVVMLASGVAHADSKADVESLIGKNLDAIQKDDWKAFDATFRPDAYYFLPSVGATHLADVFHGFHTMKLTQKIERITVVADDKTKVAWFHVDFSARYQYAVYYGDGVTPPWNTDRTRMIGFAVNDGGWKLGAVGYAAAFADKYLYKDAGQVDKAPVVFKGERTTAEYAQRWFTKGLAVDMATGTTVVNGTAEGEWASGTAVPKLVAAWDKLKLWPIRLTGRTLKTFPIGLVIAEVGMPVKKGQGGVVEEDGAVRMRLFAVVVANGKSWKWTALSFTGWYEDDGGAHGPGQIK